MRKEMQIRTIILGETVGKTSIIRRNKDGKFNDVENITIGVDHFIMQRKYEKTNTQINLDFKDKSKSEVYINNSCA